MTHEEEDQISQAKIEAEQAQADREALLKEINDLRNKVRVHQSAAGVQQRHAEDYRDKLEKYRSDKKRLIPHLNALLELNKAKELDAEAVRKALSALEKEMNG